ncbi:hypothetical protein HZB94_04460 [Candidatus Falkowbacteria bacterium]|nr:hypothetical protein [Candidatus Falkowbacteria bacterium]
MRKRSFKKMRGIVLFAAIMLLLAPSVIFGAGNPEAETINKALTKIDKLFPGEMVKSDDLAANFGNVVSIFLGIIGTVALLMFIWGGIIWMTSMGDMKKVTNAKDTMIWAAMGLFVIFISYILVRFLIGGLDFWK